MALAVAAARRSSLTKESPACSGRAPAGETEEPLACWHGPEPRCCNHWRQRHIFTSSRLTARSSRTPKEIPKKRLLAGRRIRRGHAHQQDHDLQSRAEDHRELGRDRAPPGALSHFTGAQCAVRAENPATTHDADNLSLTAAIDAQPKLPTLLDGLFVHESSDVPSAGKTYTQDVTLPNVNCTKCTLQVIQFMRDPFQPGYFYHHCADFKSKARRRAMLARPAQTRQEIDVAAGSAGAGGAGGAPGDGAAGNNAGGAGNRPNGAGGASAAGSSGAGARAGGRRGWDRRRHDRRDHRGWDDDRRRGATGSSSGLYRKRRNAGNQRGERQRGPRGASRIGMRVFDTGIAPKRGSLGRAGGLAGPGRSAREEAAPRAPLVEVSGRVGVIQVIEGAGYLPRTRARRA